MLSFAQLHIMCNSIAIQFHWISISNNNERMECSISYCSTSFVMLMYPSAWEFWRSLREKVTKKWRYLENSTCDWSPDVKIRFISGLEYD